MILIVGGEGSGKRSCAESLGYAREDMADGVLDGQWAVYHVERMIAEDPEGAPSLLDALAQKEIVICCEVGSGIIPAEYRQRRIREATGRLCVLLAQRADAVVRMVCGIPTVIKGELK